MQKIERKISEVLLLNIPFFILVAIFIFFAYFPALQGNFLSADDYPGIVFNPIIRDLGKSFATANFATALYSVLYYFFGLQPVAFHVVSVFMHIINTILAFLIAYYLFGKNVAMWSTLIFAAHPINSEAVSWISGSGYLYNAFVTELLFLITVLLRKTGNIRFKWIFLAVLICSLILLRSTWLIVGSLMCFLWDYLVIFDQFNQKTTAKTKNMEFVKNFCTFLAVLAVFGIGYLLPLFNQRIQDLKVTYNFTRTSEETPYLNKIPFIVYKPIELFIFPKNLSIYQEGGVITSFDYGVMILVTITLLYLIFKFRKKNNFGLVVLLSIPLAVLPSFSPVTVAWLSAERYLYVSSFIFCMVLAIGIQEIVATKLKNQKLAEFLLFFLVAAYFIRTFIRAGDFKNDISLWTSTQKVVPNSYRVYNNLGGAYANENNFEKSLENFLIAIKLNPKYAEAMHNAGHTYFQMNDRVNAKFWFKKALEIDPKLYQSYFWLGVIEFEDKNYNESLQFANKALELKSDYKEASDLLLLSASKINAQD